jgi:hypothetical protein
MNTRLRLEYVKINEVKTFETDSEVYEYQYTKLKCNCGWLNSIASWMSPVMRKKTDQLNIRHLNSVKFLVILHDSH